MPNPWDETDSLIMEAIRRRYQIADQKGNPFVGGESEAAKAIESGEDAGDYLAARELDTRTANMAPNSQEYDEEFLDYLLNRDAPVDPETYRSRPQQPSPMQMQLYNFIMGGRREL